MKEFPNSRESEIALLGSMLVFPDSLSIVRDSGLTSQDFFYPEHKTLIKVMLELLEEKMYVDVATLIDTLTSKDLLEKEISVNYLVMLQENSSAVSSLKHYIDNIKEMSQARQLIKVADTIKNKGLSKGVKVDELLNEAEDNILSITRSRNVVDIRNSNDVVNDMLTNIEKAMQSDGGMTGLLTGFRDLNNVTHGFQKGDLIILGGRPSMGKGHPNWLELPTPTGCQKVGDIKVGDYVFDRFGKPTKVTGVYPRGKLETYKVTLSDGRSTIVDGDHIWSHFSVNGKTKKESLIDKTTRFMYEQGVKNKRNRAKYRIPTNRAVDFNVKKHDVDPYVIGALIGDGSLKESRLSFSSNDDYVAHKLGGLLNSTAVFTKHKNYTWFFLNEDNEYLRTKKVLNGIEELQRFSHLKEIPKEYLYDSYDNRMKLLQGLFDTDGSAFISNGYLEVSYSTTSKLLMEQIRWLLQSCGYLSGVATDRRKGRRDCYNIRVSSQAKDMQLLFTLSRNKDVVSGYKRTIRRKHDRIGIESIVKTGQKEEITCISVENEEQLYLTNDFIVTHNTAIALNLGLNVARHNDASVAIFSLEMPDTDLMARMTSSLSTVNSNKMRSGRLRDDELQELHQAGHILKQTKLFIDDSSSITIPEIFTQCRRLKNDGQLDFIVIDYIQLITGTSGNSRQEEVSKISRQLKQLAREMEVPVLALSQLSRKLESREDKKPMLSDLRESGSIEQDFRHHITK